MELTGTYQNRLRITGAVLTLPLGGLVVGSCSTEEARPQHSFSHAAPANKDICESEITVDEIEQDEAKTGNQYVCEFSTGKIVEVPAGTYDITKYSPVHVIYSEE